MFEKEMNDENKNLSSEEDTTKVEETTEEEEKEDKEEWTSTDESWTELQDEVDELDEILASLEDNADDIQNAADDLKSSNGWEAEVEKLLMEIKKKDDIVKELTDSVTSLQTKIKALNLDKSDLVYKNAELEAFGWVNDPQLMIVVRNYEKAKGWDKWAQNKIKSIISDIWSWIYWSDIEKEAIDSSVDELTEIDSYISKRNPNISEKKKEQTTPVF